MTEVVGFIGLGIMGQPMAQNLLTAGADLVVHNRSRGAQDALVKLGARSANTIEEVASTATIIITMLPDDNSVRAAVLGKLIPAVTPGTLIIDMSTVSPAMSREVAAAALARGAHAIDAPVSGGDIGAREGTLSIMVGGAAEDLARALPLLEVLGKKIVHVGPSGAGQVVKACNQILVAITIAGVSEALILGSRNGVDPALILDVLGGGLASNRVMEVRRNHFLQHEFKPGFTVDLHHKDLQIALASGGELNVPLPLTAATQQLFRQLRAAGRGNEDHTAILAALEVQASHQIGELVAALKVEGE